MKNINIAARAAAFAVLFASGAAFAQDVTITKKPKVYFLTSAGLNPGYSRHETLSSAFADVLARYASWSVNGVVYEGFNLRFEPEYPVFSGIPTTYKWDVRRTTAQGTGVGEDRTIQAYGYCDQNGVIYPEGREWLFVQDWVKMEWRCERHIDVSPPLPPPSPPPKNDNPGGGSPGGGSCPASGGGGGSGPNYNFSNNNLSKADGGAVGNPIYPATGDKAQVEVDHSSGAVYGLQMIRLFQSSWVKGAENENSGLGGAWRHNHHSYLKQIDENVLQLHLPDGEHFNLVRDTLGENPSPGECLAVMIRSPRWGTTMSCAELLMAVCLFLRMMCWIRL